MQATIEKIKKKEVTVCNNSKSSNDWLDFKPFESKSRDKYIKKITGSTSISGTNFLTQPIQPLLAVEFIDESDVEIQQRIKLLYPKIYDYIKDEIENGRWKTDLNPVTFLSDCINLFCKKYDFRCCLNSNELWFYKFYEDVEERDYSFDFKPLLMYRNTPYFDCIIGLMKHLFSKMYCWGDHYTVDIILDMLKSDDDPDNKALKRNILRKYKKGLPNKYYNKIMNSTITIDQLNVMVNNLKPKSEKNKQFKNVLLLGLEVLKFKDGVNDYTHGDFNDNGEATPLDYITIMWSWQDFVGEQYCEYLDEHCNNIGLLNFMHFWSPEYDDHLKLNVELSNFPKVLTDFMDRMQSFIYDYHYKVIHERTKQFYA